MPQPLTRLERRVLNYVIDYLRRNTYQPSVREIGKKFGIKSTKTVSEHLQALADKGHIERDASRSRGVKLLGISLAPNVVEVPLYGSVGAGETAVLDYHVEARFGIDRALAGGEDTFFLRVAGDSMRDAGIVDGDLVLVHPLEEPTISDGEIVAVRLGREAFAKRFYKKDDQIVLEPAHPDYPPMLVRDDDDFEVLGRVTGLFRHLAPEHAGASA